MMKTDLQTGHLVLLRKGETQQKRIVGIWMKMANWTTGIVMHNFLLFVKLEKVYDYSRITLFYEKVEIIKNEHISVCADHRYLRVLHVTCPPFFCLW